MTKDGAGAGLVLTRLLILLYALVVFYLVDYCWRAPWGRLSTALAALLAIVGLVAVAATLSPRYFAALKIAGIVHTALGLLLFFPFLRDALPADSRYPVTMAVFVVLNVSLPLLVVIRVWHHIAATSALRLVGALPGVRHPQELGILGWALLVITLFFIAPLVFVGNVVFVTAVGVIVFLGTVLGFIRGIIRGHRPTTDTSRRFRLVHRLTKPMRINHWRIMIVAERDPVDVE